MSEFSFAAAGVLRSWPKDETTIKMASVATVLFLISQYEIVAILDAYACVVDSVRTDMFHGEFANFLDSIIGFRELGCHSSVAT